ncbi:MAG TPA: hypothetical protein VN748_22565 [Pseudonocardiaceae bacterium]|nr:hypothetical protein [Pseudonocardiaceae bacterium]
MELQDMRYAVAVAETLKLTHRAGERHGLAKQPVSRLRQVRGRVDRKASRQGRGNSGGSLMPMFVVIGPLLGSREMVRSKGEPLVYSRGSGCMLSALR